MTCAHCGGPSTKSGGYQRKYCTPECRSAAAGKRQIDCAVCGTTFTGYVSKRKHCSRECAAEAMRLPPSTCDNCGGEYRPKAGDRTTYCSRDCAYKHKAWRAKRRTLIRNRNAHARRYTPCSECGAPFYKTGNATYCSDDCRRSVNARKERERAARLHSAEPRPCRECAETFVPEYGTKRSAFCSDPCAKRYHNRVGKAARRARKRKNGLVYFDPLDTMRRDRWRCQLCGVKTPKGLRGTHDDRAPELDHKVPLAMGGAHTPENTQCLCRSCNQRKGATVAGQLALPLAA